MFSAKFLVCVIGAVALLAGSAAAAAEYRVSVIGTIVEGSDDTGVFGDPGSLDGEGFTAIFDYSTVGVSRTTIPGEFDEIIPLISAALRIKGVTYTLPDFALIDSTAQAQPGRLLFSHFNAVDADPVDLQFLEVLAFSPAFLPDLDPGVGPRVPADGSGRFGISVCCCPSCGDDFEEVNAGGTLDVDFVRYAVPEPSTWALMILGFGAAGAGLRRQRARAA